MARRSHGAGAKEIHGAAGECATPGADRTGAPRGRECADVLRQRHYRDERRLYLVCPYGLHGLHRLRELPGRQASGTLPPGYNTNPYGGCASTSSTTSANPSDGNGSATSAPTYSAVIASNVYNPYSGWGI